MRVRFWGTRGSIPKPGPSTLRYGGNTSCVEVQSSDGTTIVLDCGTGAAALGADLMKRQERPLRSHLLISHSHWDHIQGLPFFVPLFVPGNEWDVYGPHGFLQSVRETLAGQMQHTYFPVDIDQLGATIRYHDLTEGIFTIGDITVRTRYLNHPALTLGYRLEADGVSVAYCCDHEPHSRAVAAGVGEMGDQDREHIGFIAGADLVIHDAQYRAVEYAEKLGWGHSTLEYAVAIAERAQAKTLAFTHHDPNRDDDEIDTDVERVQGKLRAKGSALTVIAAAEGLMFELKAQRRQARQEPPDAFSAEITVAPRMTEKSVLLGIAEPKLREQISQALHADGIRILQASDKAAALELAQTEAPALIVLERDLPGDGLATCRALREAGALPTDLPIIMAAEREETGVGCGVTDWLIAPFSSIYARARMRAWLMRTACRWVQPPLPANEVERLTALDALGILDTEPEERFDRLTRIAAATFDVPIALVSLIDRDRQWFKSACGGIFSESPRDMSFCAHAILDDRVMVVPDALSDPRFADNPAVVGEPRVRFYAGSPLVIDSGIRVGTLCLADTRPRDLDQARIEALSDLADLVVQELQRPMTR
jgi:phosphoribosyl 1,2-cyclic phosphodiesterase/CheY-like chemotaxis protein